jgi:hypothetical protein
MRCTWLLLLLAAPLAHAQPVCSDGSRPVCSDGSNPAPPGSGSPCASGQPLCADGTTLGGTATTPQATGGWCSHGQYGRSHAVPLDFPSPSSTVTLLLHFITGRWDGAGCVPTSGTCTADGLSNYVQRSYTYGADGKITGTIKTNNCITHSVSSGSSGTFSCEEQTFPDPSYASTPAAIPLLGRAGMRCAARAYGRGHTLMSPRPQTTGT